MSKQVAVLVCPGRGSYGKEQLGFLAQHLRPGSVADALALADRERADQGQPTVSALDGAARFRPSQHLAGQNAAALIYFSTMAQVAELRAQYDIVAVLGNSLGWYTALAAAGAVSPEDGWRLVSSMARLQELAPGGQLLTTTVGDDWRRDPAAAAAVDDALRQVGDGGAFVARSIRLGGHEVLAGTEEGVRELLRVLPAQQIGQRTFPFQLAGHGPFHTALCSEVAERAASELADLAIRPPEVFLIDGRGDSVSPWSADPQELLRYTTTTQVTSTFDFSAAVRTALREFQPEVVVCAGPGDSLRAPVGHVVIAERFGWIEDRPQLFASEFVQQA